MKKKSFIILVSLVITLLIGISITFAFFTSDIISSNTTLNYNLVYEANDFNFNVTIKGMNTKIDEKQVMFSISQTDMFKKSEDVAVGFDSTTFQISINNTSDSKIYCIYDYIWNWDSSSDNYTLSPGAQKELTVQGPFRETQVPNTGVSSNYLLGQGSIAVKATESKTKEDVVITKFYNLESINQAAHAGKKYKGIISIDNVKCSTSVPENLDFVELISSKSGVGGTYSGLKYSVVNQNGNIRYVGKYPPNFVTFNGESWRIIGVFNMQYDTDGDNIPDTTAPLVKMIRNDLIGSGSMAWDAKGPGMGTGTISTNSSGTNYYGSDDWSESQLMMMLNPVEFLNQGYDSSGNRIENMKICDDDSSYICDINNNKVFKNMGAYWKYDLGNVYKPSNALTTGYTPTLMTASSSKWYNYKKLSEDAQDMIATVKWSTTSSKTFGNTAVYTYYLREYNIDNNGTTDAKKPAYWYGKVGLLYINDYGYATYGNPSNTDYTRDKCLVLPMRNITSNTNNWGKGDGQTNCAYTDWLLFVGANSTSIGARSSRWTMSQQINGNGVWGWSSSGGISTYYISANMDAQPVIYLKPGVKFATGNGTSENPYTLSLESNKFSSYVNTDIETIPEGFYEIPKYNLYRFLGDYEESDSNYSGKVDNYICLGSNAATCPADNMYRIIGVVAQDDLNVTGLKAGMIKVIKNTPIGQYTWDGGTSLSDPNRNVNDSNYQTWIDADTKAPTWEESYLNTNILNETFLNSLSFKNRIASVKWHCYTNTSSTYYSSSENAASLCATARKISLMYAADYMDSWGKINHGVYTYANSNNISWLHLCNDNTNIGTAENQIYPCDQTTMSNYGYILDNNISYWRTYIIGNSPTQNGLRSPSNYYSTAPKSTAQSVRPVFFLNNDVKITSGAGTYSNPFRVVF